MKTVVQNSQFHIYDDVLKPEEFDQLWQYVQLQKFASVHKNGWNKVWRMTDGLPLSGANVIYEQDPGEPSCSSPSEENSSKDKLI